MLDKKKFYINGKWIFSLGKNELEVINPSTEEAFLATFCTFSTRGQLVSARSARLWNQMRSTGAWYRPICCLVIVRCLPEMSCSQQAMRACAQCLELGGKPIMIPADRN